jgi:uncharacterized membrane protein (DUF4010 family)
MAACFAQLEAPAAKRARTEAAKEGAAAAGAAAERLTRSAAEKDARDMQVRGTARQETANAHMAAILIVLAMQNSKLTLQAKPNSNA